MTPQAVRFSALRCMIERIQADPVEGPIWQADRARRRARRQALELAAETATMPAKRPPKPWTDTPTKPKRDTTPILKGETPMTRKKVYSYPAVPDEDIKDLHSAMTYIRRYGSPKASVDAINAKMDKLNEVKKLLSQTTPYEGPGPTENSDA